VFAADVKGDLSGLSKPGEASDRVTSRAAELGVEWTPAGSTTAFFSLGGLGPGVPIRATITSFGPQLLAKVLGANPTQTSSLSLVFRYADQAGLALLDLDDLREVLKYLASDDGKAELKDMANDGRGRVRIEYRVSARGLIGFQSEFMNATRGTGLQSHIFDGYAPLAGDIPDRHNGVLISSEPGFAVAYSIFALQERGRMFVSHGEAVYEGMIIGIHSRENDLVVNPIKTKKLTNVRAAGKDDALILTPPIELTLEYAVEFIADDELVEVTPKNIRIRKRLLQEHERKRASRVDEALLA
jgi:hypothetical protein